MDYTQQKEVKQLDEYQSKNIYNPHSLKNRHTLEKYVDGQTCEPRT